METLAFFPMFTNCNGCHEIKVARMSANADSNLNDPQASKTQRRKMYCENGNMYVCRFCLQWKENSGSVCNESVLLNTIDLFGLELECGPDFPRNVCERCCMLLEQSVKFYEQINDSELALWRFRKAGRLAALLADPKECGTTLGYTDDDDALVQPMGEDAQSKTKVQVEDITIEALKDFEMVSEAYSEDEATVEQEDYTSSDNLEILDMNSSGQLDESEVLIDHETVDGASFIDDDALVQPMGEDAQLKTKEQVEDITIEAQEDFEMVSEPYGEDEATVEQEDHTSSDNREILDMNLSGQLDESEVLIDHETVEDVDKPNSTETNVAHIIVESTSPRPTEDRPSSKCFICNTVLSNATELETHLLEHENLLPYRCERCSTVERPLDIESNVGLNNHLESHTFAFVCYQCPLRYRNYPAWRQHVSVMHPGPFSHTCGLCGMHFEERRNFSQHMNGHRYMNLQRYKCATCGKAFRKLWLWKRHEVIHSRNTRFKCPHCTRVFKHKSNFEVHLRCHKQHGSAYQCTRCSAEYVNSSDWRRHMKEHSPKNPRYWELQDVLPEALQDGANYPQGCIEPGYTATVRTHFKAFQCERCPQKFASQRYLRKHIDVMHRGLRPHECSKCGKRFGYRQTLVLHMTMHERVRKLRCKYCGKRFTHSSNLSKHERAVHTVGKQFMCDRCGDQFRTSSAFAKHRSQHDQGAGVRKTSKSCTLRQSKRSWDRDII